MGKGDERRPTMVDEETFTARWARAFGKPPPKQDCLTCTRNHRVTPYCCYECQQSGGEVHSIGCDITWRERNE